MALFLVKRVFYGLVTLWLIASVTFLLVHMLPGDPFSSEKAIPPTVKKKLMEKYQLDKPLIVQYGIYMTKLIQGDLGVSMKIDNKNVTAMIKEGFPYSLDLGVRATVFALIGGLLLGIIAALNRGKNWDTFSMLFAVIGVSVPSFILGGLFQWFFAVKLHLLPVAQYESFKYTIMPTVALGMAPLAVIARMIRASMIEVMSQDYIKTAKAKGLSPFQIVMKHGLRNAIMPVITYLGYLIAGITVGSFVVETIFVIPGLGRAYVTSIENNDYTLVLGLTVFYAMLLIVTILIMDIVYGIINPKIRVAGRGGK